MRRASRKRRSLRGLLTWADRLLIYVLAGVALVMILVPRDEDGAVVRITGSGGFRQELALDSDVNVEVAGPLGTTVVRVDVSGARVVSSPCPHGLCVSMGSAAESGQSVVCIPNEVVVTVIGTSTTADAVTR